MRNQRTEPTIQTYERNALKQMKLINRKTLWNLRTEATIDHGCSRVAICPQWWCELMMTRHTLLGNRESEKILGDFEGLDSSHVLVLPFFLFYFFVNLQERFRMISDGSHGFQNCFRMVSERLIGYFCTHLFNWLPATFNPTWTKTPPNLLISL